MKIWNVAVVGCGGISKIFFDNMIYKMDNLNVVACCSKHGESAKRKAAEYGIKAMKYEEILVDADIEVIVNLTPVIEHYAIIKSALEHGKHVYTEKVMTATYAEAKELIDLAKSKNLMLGSAPDTCLGAAIQTGKMAVETGMIGEVTGCVVSLNRNLGVMYDRIPFLVQPAAGIGFDFGIYGLTALFTLLGPVIEVSGKTKIRKPNRINENRESPYFGEQYEVKGENIMVGQMEFKNGAFGTVLFNGNSIYMEKPYISIQGTDGILFLPDPNQFGGKVILQRQVWGGTEEELEMINSYTDNSRGLGVSELMLSFDKGGATDESMMKAAHAIEVLEGFVESGKTQKFITINSTFKKDKVYTD